MATELAEYTVIFPEDYDERGEWEVEQKGWFSGVVVALAGRRYGLFFYDPVRLRQDLEADARQERPLVAEPGLVVLPELTRATMLDAVGRLVREGFFRHLQPLTNEEPGANGTP